MNFIPVIDHELEYWFKKDSLWYSEDIAAVPNRDAGRCCILQGPVAVHYSTVLNEPAADILNGIVNEHAKMLKIKNGQQDSSMPVGHCFSCNVHEVEKSKDVLDVICRGIGWRDALLRSTHIVRGQRRHPNPLPLLFKERDGQVWEFPNVNHVQIKEKGNVSQLSKIEKCS